MGRYKPIAGRTFWSLIKRIDWDADDPTQPLVDALAERPVADICGFEERLAVLLHALDGERYARETGDTAYVGPDEHFSVDAFLYARACVVANGKKIYDDVLKDPEKLPKDVDFEDILYVAQYAYEARTGREWEYVTSTDYETFSNVKGWETAASSADASEAKPPSKKKRTSRTKRDVPDRAQLVERWSGGVSEDEVFSLLCDSAQALSHTERVAWAAECANRAVGLLDDHPEAKKIAGKALSAVKAWLKCPCDDHVAKATAAGSKALAVYVPGKPDFALRSTHELANSVEDPVDRLHCAANVAHTLVLQAVEDRVAESQWQVARMLEYLAGDATG